MRFSRHKEQIKWLVIALIPSVIMCFYFRSSLTTLDLERKYNISEIIISLYGTLLGFLLALLAIVLSLTDKTLIKNMILSGHYHNLITSSKILSSLFAIVLLFLIIGSLSYQFFPLLFVINIGLSLSTFIFAVRTTYKFFQVFTYI